MTFEQLLGITNRLSAVLFGPDGRLGLAHSISGIGVAFKSADPNPNREFCLQIYVQRKLLLEQVLPAELITGFLSGAPTEIVQVGRFFAFSPAAAPAIVVAPGFGMTYEKTGGSSSSPGTLGAVLADSQNARYALSANHVLSRNGDFFNDPGSIVETGPPGGNEDSVLARNKGDVLFSKLSMMPDSNAVDCAMAKPVTSISLKQFWPPELRNATANAVDAVIGRTVGKFGNESKWKTGTVVSTGTFHMHCAGMGEVRIQPGIFIKGDFAQPGDSGSVVFQQNGDAWEPMGLLLAGSVDNEDTLATEHYVGLCSLKLVMAALESTLPSASRPLRLVAPEFAPPPAPPASPLVSTSKSTKATAKQAKAPKHASKKSPKRAKPKKRKKAVKR